MATLSAQGSGRSELRHDKAGAMGSQYVVDDRSASGDVLAVILDGQLDVAWLVDERPSNDRHGSADGFALVPDLRIFLEGGVQIVSSRGVEHDAEKFKLFLQ